MSHSAKIVLKREEPLLGSHCDAIEVPPSTVVAEEPAYFTLSLSHFLRKEMREQRTSLLVLDGLTPLGDLAPSSLAFERFLERLQATTQAHNGVTVLLSQPTLAGEQLGQVVQATRNIGMAQPQHLLTDGECALEQWPGGSVVALAIEHSSRGLVMLARRFSHRAGAKGVNASATETKAASAA